MSDLDRYCNLNDYDFELPEKLIAQQPTRPRDASRLLVLHRQSGLIEHKTFKDLSLYLREGDCLVANNSRVIKARLLGQRLLHSGPEGKGPPRLGGRVEFVLLEELKPKVWEGLFHASAKYVPGVTFEIPTPDGHGLRGVLVRGSKESAQGTVVAEFDRDPIESGAGEIPLPKYIHRANMPLPQDEQNYQTVYAKYNGSAAAPTAGLHFTDEVMGSLKAKGVTWDEVTLHVGLGTFRPVKDEDIRLHPMHEERYEIPHGVATRLTEAKRAGRRIIAVGTTSVRTIESAWNKAQSEINGGEGRTSLFIHPVREPAQDGSQADFNVVSGMITNFHLPKSTLLMLISAFAGREHVLKAYREAVEEHYRFFSYGDAMLII